MPGIGFPAPGYFRDSLVIQRLFAPQPFGEPVPGADVIAGKHIQRLQSAKHDVFGPSICQEYDRSDVFCLPSVQEGFGSAFLEAMTAGKPIVAARAAAVPEVIRNGILVEPENPEALAEAVVRLYRDPGLRILSFSRLAHR